MCRNGSMLQLKSRAQQQVGHGFFVGGIYYSSQEQTRQSTFFSFYHLPFAHFGIYR